MTDQLTEPNNAEILKRLEQLEKQNAELRAAIADANENQRVFMTAMQDELMRLGDALWPVVGKVFPNFHEMKKKMDAIVQPCFVDPRINEKLDERPS